MNIERLHPGPRMSQAVKHGNTLYLAGQVARDEYGPALAARKIPFPKIVLVLGSTYQVGFGIMLAAGLLVSVAALALVVFTIVASVMLVNFWDKQEPERSTLFGVFLSNIAIIGGLLAIAAAS